VNSFNTRPPPRATRMLQVHPTGPFILSLLPELLATIQLARDSLVHPTGLIICVTSSSNWAHTGGDAGLGTLLIGFRSRHGARQTVV
jgi:hypothetical protein